MNAINIENHRERFIIRIKMLTALESLKTEQLSFKDFRIYVGNIGAWSKNSETLKSKVTYRASPVVVCQYHCIIKLMNFQYAVPVVPGTSGILLS